MKKILIGLALVLTACGSLSEQYVRQDEANFKTLAPRIRKMMSSTAELTTKQKGDVEDRLQGWEARITAALDSMKEAKDDVK